MPTLDLLFRLLPTQLIVANFVDGCGCCNYEMYVRDFINASNYFLAKSHNEQYIAPSSEEKGQCDCISHDYQLDFKLFLSETMGQGKREFSTSITQLCPGVTSYGKPNITSTSPNYKPIDATYLHVAFRILSFDEICGIGERKYKCRGYERDISLVLKDARKAKNILWMLPYEFYYKDDVRYEDGRAEIVSALNTDLENLIRYRKLKQPQFDTFVAFIHKNKFIILNSVENRLEIVDEVELKRSAIYQELLGLSEY